MTTSSPHFTDENKLLRGFEKTLIYNAILNTSFNSTKTLPNDNHIRSLIETTHLTLSYEKQSSDYWNEQHDKILPRLIEIYKTYFTRIKDHPDLEIDDCFDDSKF